MTDLPPKKRRHLDPSATIPPSPKRLQTPSTHPNSPPSLLTRMSPPRTKPARPSLSDRFDPITTPPIPYPTPTPRSLSARMSVPQPIDQAFPLPPTTRVTPRPPLSDRLGDKALPRTKPIDSVHPDPRVPLSHRLDPSNAASTAELAEAKRALASAILLRDGESARRRDTVRILEAAQRDLSAEMRRADAAVMAKEEAESTVKLLRGGQAEMEAQVRGLTEEAGTLREQGQRDREWIQSAVERARSAEASLEEYKAQRDAAEAALEHLRGDLVEAGTSRDAARKRIKADSARSRILEEEGIDLRNRLITIESALEGRTAELRKTESRLSSLRVLNSQLRSSLDDAEEKLKVESTTREHAEQRSRESKSKLIDARTIADNTKREARDLVTRAETAETALRERDSALEAGEAKLKLVKGSYHGHLKLAIKNREGIEKRWKADAEQLRTALWVNRRLQDTIDARSIVEKPLPRNYVWAKIPAGLMERSERYRAIAKRLLAQRTTSLEPRVRDLEAYNIELEERVALLLQENARIAAIPRRGGKEDQAMLGEELPTLRGVRALMNEVRGQLKLFREIPSVDPVVQIDTRDPPDEYELEV